MSLPSGARIGPYEIGAQIGAGGMGEVYRATDTNLKRAVAIKVLPAALAQDAERLARFQREAEVLAALNHPHIAAIYGLERTADTTALVMELVEGPTLADRIASTGALPLDETLAIATQIAEALEAAHDQGIIHRDLKPANIKVRDDGTVKVLDFGLAKIVEPGRATGTSVSASLSPTITTPAMTMAGVILGTAAYMSPEQAKGKPADKRSDIWAFGCVLYEMLTGKRAFDGETMPEVLAAVLRHTPDLTIVPAQSRRLLEACLEKDPARRLRDVGDAWRLVSATGVEATSVVAARPGRAPWWMAAAAGAAIAIAVWAPWRAAPAPAEVVQLQLPLPDGVTLSSASPFATSPDGRTLAFVGSGTDGISRVWIRSLGSLDARPLRGTETDATTPAPFWSPDSQSIAFTASGKLKKVEVTTGAVLEICDLPQVAPGGSWNRDGIIIFPLATRGVMRVAASGGSLTQLTEVDPSRQERTHNNPVFLPDGRHFVYLRTSENKETIGLYIGSIDLGPSQQSLERVVETNFGGDYSSDGRGGGFLLFRRDTSLLAQRFDVSGRKLTGEPRVIAERLTSYFSGGMFSVSDNGVLVYRAGESARSSRLILLDRDGREVKEVGERGGYSGVAISPDGTSAIVRRTDNGAADLNLWLVDLSSGNSRRLSSQQFSPGAPVWSPDGRSIIYSARGKAALDLFRMSIASGDEEPLLTTDQDKEPLSWSRTEPYLLFRTRHPQQKEDLWALPLEGQREAFPIVASKYNEDTGRFSPTDPWLAYVSDDSGRPEVYLRRFSPDARTTAESNDIMKVSRDGGERPRWRADGRELFYVGPGGTMMAVAVERGASLRVGPPKMLFPLPRGTAATDTDGTGRTLAVVPLEQGTQAPFNVVLNWTRGR